MSKMKVSAGLVSGDSPLHSLQTAVSSPGAARARAAVFPLIKMLIWLDQDPIIRTSSNLNCFPKGSISKYSHTGGGGRASTYEFWGT